MVGQTQQQGWQTAENIAQRGFLARRADLDRDLQQTLQAKQITANDVISAGQADCLDRGHRVRHNRALQKALQEADIQFAS